MCGSHGDGVDNIYDWKGLYRRWRNAKPLRNLGGIIRPVVWDIMNIFVLRGIWGPEPVPVVAAGCLVRIRVLCSHHSVGELGCGGQQGGIPMEEMPQYVQDILGFDRICEWRCEETVWGKKRTQTRTLNPFNLKYIGIGNEDLITDIFEERFTMIFNAVKGEIS